MIKGCKDWYSEVVNKLNQNVTKTETENEYRPNLAIDDAKRKQFFTNYNLELANRIREIKLNQL